MDTEEVAIEFVRSFKEVVTSIDIENGDGKAIEEYNDKIDNVIDLLKRGEKYEAIEKGIKQYCLILENQNVLKEVIRLEQKYFPKPKKKVVKWK